MVLSPLLNTYGIDMIRYFIEFDYRQKLVFVVLENFGTQIVTVPVTHTFFCDSYFHTFLLCFR